MIRKADFRSADGAGPQQVSTPTGPTIQVVPLPEVRDGRRWAMGIGFGTLAALGVFLFLAWIQPVGRGSEKIELSKTFQFKLAPKSSKPQTATPKKEPKKKPPRERPKKVEKTKKKAVSPRSTRKVVRSAAPTPTLRAPNGGGFGAGANLLGGGGGGGATLSLGSMNASQISVASQVVEMQDYKRQRQAVRDRRNALTQRKKGARGRAKDPQPVYTPEARYPAKARKSQIEGFVHVNVLIGVKGDVEDHEILAADPEGLFEEAVANILPRWRFRAAQDEEGRPIESWLDFRLEFKMKD